jgi:hypothetical protein
MVLLSGSTPFPVSAGCPYGPPSSAGLGVSRVLVRQAPHQRGGIGTASAGELAIQNRVAPRAYCARRLWRSSDPHRVATGVNHFIPCA